jgi:hypothetical protein
VTEGTKRGVAEMVDGSLALTGDKASAELSKPQKVKRRSLLAQAVIGDLVIALNAEPDDPKQVIAAIQQVSDATSAEEIVEEWRDLSIIGAKDKPEVWERRPGGYYRRRRAGR